MKLSNRHVLIIDDDRINCEILERSIRVQGGNATVCYNTSDASHLLSQLSIDLILLDMHFPEGDAFPFLTSMQHDEILKKIPIVVISSDNNEKTIIQALNNGAVDYLLKPIKLWQLLPIISKYIKDIEEKTITLDQNNNLTIKCDIEMSGISSKEITIIAPVKFSTAEESIKVENTFLAEMNINEAICKTSSISQETGLHSQYQTRLTFVSITEQEEDEIQKRIVNWMT